ncbi:hypothetical protein OO013_04810 [Mangrovivirga sp. M17]|uniref:Lipoprotein n=1 Tax=Mangrovivirga halotolerans TaxID=2993936 RepID=A0ABT3RNK4_9BACT|nr:hypothetical protein [Mangrovivirga halotolerans]MCX2743172.1 hypothetical protein [Mangrovivirga halotolerans]
MRVFFFSLITISVFLFGCDNLASTKKETNDEEKIKNQPITFSLANEEELKKLESLKLDSGYVNLLLPAYNSEENIQKVRRSWSDLHQELGDYLSKNNFDWGVGDSSISLFNKIYFAEDGTIDYYAFKVITPSVSEETTKNFEKLLKEFSSEVKLDLGQNKNFAQCGKSRIMNK